MRYISAEGGRFPFDFDQRPMVIGGDGQPERVFPDELPVGETVQALLAAPPRNRRIKLPAGTPAEPELKQGRQSRITAALAGPHPKFAYRPAESDYSDVGVRFDRANAAAKRPAARLHPSISTKKFLGK